ncbi:MAG: hypothetical protein JXR45_10060 [Deltaproteobacteria bacterium]|nr:hypothetical protein [Deltaproteobacteria bacterium]
MVAATSCRSVEQLYTDDTTDPADTPNDTSRLVLDGDCAEGESRCADNVVYMCYDGRLQAWDNCSYNDRTCIEYDEGEYRCSSPSTSDGDVDGDADTDADADIDVDMECDGEGMDCYSECLPCAAYSVCFEPIDLCLIDNGCEEYLNCALDNCCENEAECLSKSTSSSACLSECVQEYHTSADSVALFNNIGACMVCTACSYSCGTLHPGDFPMCTGDGVNTPTNPCYAEQATLGETACFSWAGWGGPCTDAQNACHDNAECAELEVCINDSWSDDNWQNLQAICFATYPNGEELYWAFMQCIYCDACDLACAADAQSKHCDEYTP